MKRSRNCRVTIAIAVVVARKDQQLSRRRIQERVHIFPSTRRVATIVRIAVAAFVPEDVSASVNTPLRGVPSK